MDLLAKAEKSLGKALGSTAAPSSQAHSLDSIAASLLYIAQNINDKPVLDEGTIELVVRRLLDNRKEPTTKKAGKK